MISLTQTEKDFIQANTIKDSGVISWESYHSFCNELAVTNMNLGGPGFDADRVYFLTSNGERILTSRDLGKILDKYTELMLGKYEKEIKSLLKIDRNEND